MPASEEQKSTLTEDLYTSKSVPEGGTEGVERSGSDTKRPESTLETWVAPSRPFKRRDRQFWVTVIAMAGVVGLVLFLVEGFMPVILIISIVFLFYVLSTVPPEDIKYEITNKGIKIGGRLTEWANMNRFWFTRRFNSELLVVEIFTLPGRLEIVVNPDKKDSIQKTISKYLTHEEVPPSGLDKAANWVGKKIPGNS